MQLSLLSYTGSLYRIVEPRQRMGNNSEKRFKLGLFAQ